MQMVVGGVERDGDNREWGERLIVLNAVDVTLKENATVYYYIRKY